MKLLVDMNLSVNWVPMLLAHGWSARHWSEVGPGNAPDTELMRWAKAQDHVVLTQDLDYSQLLFTSKADGPSVVLLRMKNEFDVVARRHVFTALKWAETLLSAGALLTISSQRVRIRRLPIADGE